MTMQKYVDGVLVDMTQDEIDVLAAQQSAPAIIPVPTSVTNFQARAVMRKYPMTDGRSLFTTVDTDLRNAVSASASKAEFDQDRVAADLSWQAWEQANDYDRNGAITQLLAQRYGFDGPTTDELFRQASQVTA